MKLPKVIIIADEKRYAVKQVLNRVLALLGERAIIAARLEPGARVPGTLRADYAFVLGGDGSILAAGRMLGERGIPLVGVNLGKLGFLTEFTMPGLEADLDDILRGKCPVEERMILSGSVMRKSGETVSILALNDFVVSHGGGVRMIELGLEVDGEFVTVFRADGLIIATPAGSTAYSMAAGGPILAPKMDALAVTPICPHTLSARPLVVPANRDIRVTLRSGERGKALVAVDGQEVVPMNAGDSLVAKTAGRHWKIVMKKSKSFFETLRTKLNWGGSANYAKDKK
jgi:NAD+ kinase